MVKYLLNNRKHATYWNSTRDTAVIVEALATHRVRRDGPLALAGLATGVWPDRAAIQSTTEGGRTFDPSMDQARRDELYAGWKRAVERALRWEP